MTGLPDLQIASAMAIGLAALGAAWHSTHREVSLRWRVAMPIAQLASAAAFYLLLFPPQTSLRVDTLTVLTPGVTPQQRSSLPMLQPVIALPASLAASNAERAPDLATAVRRHPAATNLRVLGNGLSPRDRPAADGYGLSFDAAPAQGLIELQAPAIASAGTQWRVQGRIAGTAMQVELQDPSGTTVDAATADEKGRFEVSALARAIGASRFELRVLDRDKNVIDRASVPVVFRGGSQWRVQGRVAGAAVLVELQDPSGSTVDTAMVDATGRFDVSALARAIGASRFELRVLDRDKNVIDRASVPVVFRGGSQLSMLVRAGAPDADLKYWRRWAADAGIRLAVSVGLSDGLALRDGDASLTPEALARTDLVIIDERAWITLRGDEKSALIAAVHEGLGLLLRVGGVPEAAVTADWAALGIQFDTLDTLDTPRGVTLDRALGLRTLAPFTAAPVRLPANAAVELLASDAGEPLASAVDLDRGRVGVWTLIDSYRLVLLGEVGHYGGLWSRVIEQLARPRPRDDAPPLPSQAWAGERTGLCELAVETKLAGPDDAAIPLLISADGCAAVWPSRPGWYTLVSGSKRWPFYVRAADDGVQLRAARDRAATEALAGPPNRGVPTQNGKAPLPRWPFLAGWLLMTTAIWMRERRRFADE